MSGRSIKEVTMELVAEVIERPLEELDLDAHLVDDWGIDSLMALEILAVMEKEFGIRIGEEELANFATIRQIIEVAERKVSELKAA